VTITEANHLNTLLRHLLDLPRRGAVGAVPSDGEAADAAAYLAGRANKALGAGLTPGDVLAAWPELGDAGDYFGSAADASEFDPVAYRPVTDVELPEQPWQHDLGTNTRPTFDELMAAAEAAAPPVAPRLEDARGA
jgi:hypothetical protein